MKIEVLDRPAVLARIEKAITAIDRFHARKDRDYEERWRKNEDERRRKAARKLPIGWLRGVVPYRPTSPDEKPPPLRLSRYPSNYPSDRYGIQRSALVRLRAALMADEFGTAYLCDDDIALINRFENNR